MRVRSLNKRPKKDCGSLLLQAQTLEPHRFLNFVLQAMAIARSFLCEARYRANIKRDRISNLKTDRKKKPNRIGRYGIKNEQDREVCYTFSYKLYFL